MDGLLKILRVQHNQIVSIKGSLVRTKEAFLTFSWWNRSCFQCKYSHVKEHNIFSVFKRYGCSCCMAETQHVSSQKVRLTACIFLSHTASFCFRQKCKSSTQPTKTHLLNNEIVLLLMRFVTVGEGDMIQKVNKLFQMYKYLYHFIEKTPTVTHFLLAQVSQIP